MRSGTLAREAKISVDTLRHYERIGLLAAPPRTLGGYREYPAPALQRVILIQRALSLGFSLTELRDILRERDKGGAPCRRVAALARTRLAQLDAQMRELQTLRRHIVRILRGWEARLAKTPKGRQARLLEDLPHGTPRVRRPFPHRIQQ
ncbi:MAG: MerR family transcriptional regulator [Candidatus Acidiferrales bacterium]|jgi:DNA-binding transcriptional MerR regulator